MKRGTPPAAPAALLPLVDRIARKVRSSWPMPAGMEMEDLVAEGTVGLLEACQRFDSDRSCSLPTFASFRIRGAMLDALRKRYTEVNREVLLGDRVPPGTCAIAEETVLYGEVLRSHVAGLPDQDRALVLGRLEGETFQEMGRQLGVCRAEAFRRHRKVLDRLRDRIIRALTDAPCRPSGRFQNPTQGRFP